MTHRRAKNRRAARDRLRQAEALFDDMGAAIWRDRARRELGRISGRAAGDRNALTSTERQIAELVATGKTNREVAAELFVTVRTVEASQTRSTANSACVRGASLRRVAANGRDADSASPPGELQDRRRRPV